MTRIVPMIVGACVALALATETHATLNACTSAKEACVAKKTAALLKCHSKNTKPPMGLDPAKFAACKQKAKDKFDGGANPAKGCFAKLEAKYGVGGCLTSADVAALEAQVDDFVDAVICALDPGAGTCPPPTPTPTSTPACQANGGFCSSAAQCCSLGCFGNVCAPSCTNGFQDGAETGIDCGGPDCGDCPLGGGCAGNNDCVATTVCSAGQCACAPNQSNCNGSPTDGCEANTSTDTNNCGGCNLLCSIQNGSPQCTAGQCQVGSCVPGFADCDSLTATGCEVDTDTSNSNCGNCGNICPMGDFCVNGICQ